MLVKTAKLNIEKLKQPKSISIKKIFLYFIFLTIVFITGFILNKAKIHRLFESRQEFLVIKQYISDQKNSVLSKKAKLTQKRISLSNKLIKIKLLKNSPKLFLNSVSNLLPKDVRLESFNYQAKKNLTLKGYGLSSQAIALFLEGLQNCLYIPSCNLVSGGYNACSGDYFYTILIKL
jgi:Fimbrial assembly protein (PilN)